MRARYRTCVPQLLFIIFAATPLQSVAASPTDRVFQHRQFQRELQQDALNFQLQQSLRGRSSDLAPADARRLDALQLQQRLEYQQLEQRQVERELSLQRQAPYDIRRLETQRELFAQERQLEVQRFELDRQRLLQSLPREPLQPPADAGRLR